MSLWNLSHGTPPKRLLLFAICKMRFLHWFPHFIDAMEITLIFYLLCFHSWHNLMPVKNELIFGNDSSGDLGPECRYCFLFTTLHGMLWSGHFTPLHYTHPISVNLLFILGLRLTRTLLSLCSFPIWRPVNPIHHGNTHIPLWTLARAANHNRNTFGRSGDRCDRKSNAQVLSLRQHCQHYESHRDDRDAGTD